jgi:starch synthase
VRDLPLALADAGHWISVITPAYGLFSRLPGTERLAGIKVNFGGKVHTAELSRHTGPNRRIEYLFLDHPIISAPGKGVIYHDDGPDNPFETDATRFAFFSVAVAACVEQAAVPPDILHLQDWHTGFVLALRRYDRSFKQLRTVRTVFTIHNLAIQGIRPLKDHASSFETWFPGLKYPRRPVSDPRYPDCVNPMAIAIRRADKLNTVSPGYAQEILQPSDPERGFSGGEGLESDLRKAAAENRLTGILNGCTYPRPGGRRPGWARLLEAIAGERHLLKGNRPARKTLESLSRRRPANVLVSIGRISDQKIALFLEKTDTHGSALESILDVHGRKIVFIMLGSGDRLLERRLMGVAAKHGNFLYLRGYSEPLPDLMYRAGDLFLMPSSFEPCGISQMLAMREGQPCVVHAVGGLKDTVTDGANGFSFDGDSPARQARNFTATVRRALALRATDRDGWETIRKNAAAMRFSWEAAASAYISDLYEFRD